MQNGNRGNKTKKKNSFRSGVTLLKLVFYTKDIRLKVRLSHPDDDFTKSYIWKEKLEFIISDNGDFMMAWTSLLPDLDPFYAEPFVDLMGTRYPVSENYDSLFKLCPDLVFKNSTDEWVFYGGTFNPWHQGHQACLNLLPEEKVCLLIPDRNPLKELREIHPVTTVLEISTKAKFKNRQYLVPSFLMQHKKNPTIEWVERMKERFPDTKMSLMMGFDCFKDIRSWIRYKELLVLLDTIYVVSRLDSHQEREQELDKIKSVASNLKIIFLGNHEYEHLSSTEMRNKKGRP